MTKTYQAPRGASKIVDALKEMVPTFLSVFVPTFILAANGFLGAPNVDGAAAFGRALLYGVFAAVMKSAIWFATTQVQYPQTDPVPNN